jgi:hypothetical protein
MTTLPNPFGPARELFVLAHGGTRAFPYPGVAREGFGDPQNAEQRSAEVRLWLGRFKAVHARVQLRIAAGGWPSRDEVAQLERYARLAVMPTETDVMRLAERLA